VSYVWIDMLTYDEQAAAQRAADKMDRDPRVRHFHDARRMCGQAVARSLGAPPGKIAWDMYLLYGADVTWTGDLPPAPLDWVHQLHGVDWADRARFHTGDDLVAGLRAMVDQYWVRPKKEGE
jgi:hypothetical protein